MLQRLFSRGVSRDRIEDAIEHSSEDEQRDALRERSAMILQRLEKKRLEARRAELAHKRAELEAAEQAELDAAEYSAAEETVETAPEAEATDIEMAEPAPVEFADEPVAAMEDFDAPRARDYDDDETLDLADAPFRATHPEMEYAVMQDEAVSEDEPVLEDEVGSAEADSETVEFRPLEEPEDIAEVTDEPAPDHFSAAENDVAFVEDAEAADLHEASAETEFEADKPATRSGLSEGLFAESEPLRPAGDVNLPFSLSRGDGDAPAGEAHHSALADQDPEAYQQLLRKAEEAKARIAKRLVTLKAEEEANAAASLLDIGAAAPPLAPDHGDEDD